MESIVENIAFSKSLKTALNKVIKYAIDNQYLGYDPYDTLLSRFPFRLFGVYGQAFAIQIQKRNPINIRPLLGIQKDINPKAMGLFLQVFSLLFQKTGLDIYKNQADHIFTWLSANYSRGYSGHCWGYNFPWASPGKYLAPFIPTAVVTGFVCKGLDEYQKTFDNQMARELILSASEFIIKDLPIYQDKSGSCISYSPIRKDICYNASLLAGEVLSMVYEIYGTKELKTKCLSLIEFVTSRQKKDGAWSYSENLETGEERNQIDFHQGYILESIYDIQRRLQIDNTTIKSAIEKGLNYYYHNQFNSNGSSLWRVPKRYPIEIHNQSQGIITFSKLAEYNVEYITFSKKIAEWTIENMLSKKGYFYYQKHLLFLNKIPYMRWSQAWMSLALTHLFS